MKTVSSVVVLSVACLALAPRALGAAVSEFGVLKVQQFSQLDALDPPALGFPPYAATAWVRTAQSNQLTAAMLQLPGGATTNLPVQAEGANATEDFDTSGALDARYPTGSYLLTMTTVADGQKSVTLSLPSGDYPPAPQLANYDDVQDWNTLHDITLVWSPFTGGTANDAVQVVIEDLLLGGEVFRTPSPGQPGALPANATSLLVPANTLTPFGLYNLKISFLRVPELDTTSYPGAVGLAGYSTTTETFLLTTGDTGADVEEYWIYQGEFLNQTGDTTVVPLGSNPFLFEACVRATGKDRVPSATLTGPSGTTLPLALETNRTELRFRSWSVSESALQTAFPPGEYLLTIQGFNDGETVIPLNLPASAFPNTPRLNNFTAAQAVQPETNFVVQWEPFAGGTADDFIQFEIFDPESASRWAASPDLGAFDALDGTAASYELEAWTLFPDWTIPGRLRFLKTLVTDTTSYPDAIGWVGRFVETSFQLKTTANLEPPPPFVLRSTELPAAVVSEDYSFLLQTESGVAPRSWSLVSGSLPPGLELDPDLGDIWGIPAASGTFNFRVRVTDSRTNVAEQSFSLGVTGAPQPLVVLTTNLTVALREIYYDGEIGYDGGAPPFRFSVASGALPPGLELNPETGLINGIPETSGDFPFTVQVTDGTGQTTQKALVLTVPPPDEPPLTLGDLTVVSPGVVSLRLLGNTNDLYTLETSSNLVDWVPVLETNLESGSVFQVTAAGGGPATYFRARLGAAEPASNPMNVVPSPDFARTVSGVFPLLTNSLSVTNAAGVIFTLEVPTNALAEATEISMTPVPTLEGIPPGAQVFGAVQLDPDGLLLFQPATLTIEFPNDLPPDVDCFAYRRWGRDLHRVLGGKTTSRIVRLPVFGFSGHGVGSGGTIPRESKACGKWAMIEAALADQILSTYPNLPAPEDLQRTFLKGFRELIYPDLKAAEKDEKRYRLSAIQFYQWLQGAQYMGLGFSREEAQGTRSVERGLLNAINRTHARCVNEKKPFLAFKLYVYCKQALLSGFANEAFDPDRIEDRFVRCFRFEAVFDSRVTWQDCSGVGGTSYAQVRSGKCLLQFPSPMTSTEKGAAGALEGDTDLKSVSFHLPPHWAREMIYDGAASNAVYVLETLNVGLDVTWLKFQRKKTDDGDKEEPPCPTDFPEEQPTDYEIHFWINAGDPIEVRVTDPDGGLTFDPGIPDEWGKRFGSLHYAEWRPEAPEEYFGLGIHKYQLDPSKWEWLEGELIARYRAEGVTHALVNMGRPALFTEITTLELRHKPKPFRGR